MITIVPGLTFVRGVFRMKFRVKAALRFGLRLQVQIKSSLLWMLRVGPRG